MAKKIKIRFEGSAVSSVLFSKIVEIDEDEFIRKYGGQEQLDAMIMNNQFDDDAVEWANESYEAGNGEFEVDDLTAWIIKDELKTI